MMLTDRHVLFLKVCEWRQKWCDEGGYRLLAAQFKDPAVCSDTEEVEEGGRVVLRKLGLEWRSEAFSTLCAQIDRDIEQGSRIGTRRKKRSLPSVWLEALRNSEEYKVPLELARQVFDEEWLRRFLATNEKELKIFTLKIWEGSVLH